MGAGLVEDAPLHYTVKGQPGVEYRPYYAIEPEQYATHAVRRHDIAGIWVAFFQECQQYRGGSRA